MRHFFFSLLAVLLLAVFLELCGAVVLHAYPSVATSRELLRGDIQLDAGLNSIPQAFLLYIPRPGLESEGYVQHNVHGYRGELVPLPRQPDTLRILFMGGSTTYGEGVKNPEDSYPAQLGRMLQADPALQGKRVEVINAGLRGGTTAEILTHYLLKYRYYRPDIAVINPGGNDPVAYVAPTYHPDYSNFRQSPEQIRPLRIQSRWMLHSRFLSAVIVMLFFPDIAHVTSFVTPFGKWEENIPAKWFAPAVDGELHKQETAFYNNLATVVREMKQDGVGVFLLSYQGNPFDTEDQSLWRRCYDHEESLLQLVADEEGVPYAPFPLDQMPPQVWVDASHLDGRGEIAKATYVYQRLLPLIQAGTFPPAPVLHTAKGAVQDRVLPVREILPAFESFLR